MVNSITVVLFSFLPLSLSSKAAFLSFNERTEESCFPNSPLSEKRKTHPFLVILYLTAPPIRKSKLSRFPYKLRLSFESVPRVTLKRGELHFCANTVANIACFFRIACPASLLAVVVQGFTPSERCYRGHSVARSAGHGDRRTDSHSGLSIDGSNSDPLVRGRGRGVGVPPCVSRARACAHARLALPTVFFRENRTNRRPRNSRAVFSSTLFHFLLTPVRVIFVDARRVSATLKNPPCSRCRCLCWLVGRC